MKDQLHIGDSGWRVTYPEGYSWSNLSAILLALSELYPNQKAVIGFDNRFLSEDMSHHAAILLKQRGWEVDLISKMFPTPAVATLVRQKGYDWGLMMTASHNPYYYNGMKIFNRYGSLVDRDGLDRIESCAHEYVKKNPPFSFDDSLKYPQLIPFTEAQEDYFKEILKWLDVDVFRKARLKVVIDPFGGTFYFMFQDFLKKIGVPYDIVPMILEPTYQKRRLEPDHTSVGEMTKLVLAKGAALGLATDVDGDRFALVNEKGEFVLPNILGPLLVDYVLRVRKEKGRIYQSISASALTEKICESQGVPCEYVPVGFQVMGQKMREHEDALMGIEETGGLAYAPHLPFKDGLMAHVLIMEMLARSGKSFTELTEDLFQRYGQFHYARKDLKFKNEANLHDWEKKEIWEKVWGSSIKSESHLDGLKYFFEGGWVLIRRAKTEPLLRIYYESLDEAMIHKMNQFIESANQ